MKPKKENSARARFRVKPLAKRLRELPESVRKGLEAASRAFVLVVRELWNRGEFFGRQGNFSRLGFVVNSKGKRIGLVAKEHYPGNNIWRYVYYPGYLEAVCFESAGRHTIAMGISESFPGCVGALKAKVFPEMSSVRVEFIQASYDKARYKREVPVKERLLTKGVETRHFYWRERMLDCFFKDLKANGIIEASFEEVDRKIGSGGENREARIQNQLRLFAEAAERNGFRLTKRERYTAIASLNE